MGKTATEQMVDILLGCANTRRSSFKRKRIIHEDIYILGGTQNEMEYNYFSLPQQDGKIQRFRMSDNMYPTFMKFECDFELVASTFISAYKYAYMYLDKQEVLKWESDGKTFYIGKWIVLDKNKNILMLMDYTFTDNSRVYNMNISCNCYDDTAPKVKKFITGPFMNAFMTARYGRCRVSIRDMASRTIDYNNNLKYLDKSQFDSKLNQKLHNIMHVTDI